MRLGARSRSSRAATTWATAGSGPGCPATITRSGSPAGRRRALPGARDPGDHAAPFAVADPARVIPVNELVSVDASAEPVRHRRLRQDRHRRLRLAARQRRRPRRDLLGPAARPVDAQPRRGPARPGRLHRHGRRHRGGRGGGGVAGRPVPPARGGRRDAADRPGRGADHGEDADARPVGAGPVAQHRERRPARPRARRSSAGDDRARRGDGRRSPGTRVVVHCAARRAAATRRRCRSGARTASRSSRSGAGFPCFGAALAGYVEATREDDEEKNRLCPSTPYRNSPADWARMMVLGARASASFGSEPDIQEWAQGCLLNPARVAPEHRERPEVAGGAASGWPSTPGRAWPAWRSWPGL